MWAEAYYDYSYAIRMEPENGGFYCSRAMVCEWNVNVTYRHRHTILVIMMIMIIVMVMVMVIVVVLTWLDLI